jgi:urease accessory protein
MTDVAWLPAAAAWVPVLVAHIVPGVTDFYAGLLHPVTAVEHLLTFVAIGLLAGQQARGVARRALTLFVCVLLVTAGLAGAHGRPLHLEGPLLASMVGVGCLVAANWRLPAAAVYACVTAVAALHGVANGAELTPAMAPVRFVAGIALAGFVVMTYAVGLARRAEAPWAGVAVRAAGSWIAAVGVLAWGAVTR